MERRMENCECPLGNETYKALKILVRDDIILRVSSLLFPKFHRRSSGNNKSPEFYTSSQKADPKVQKCAKRGLWGCF